MKDGILEGLETGWLSEKRMDINTHDVAVNLDAKAEQLNWFKMSWKITKKTEKFIAFLHCIAHEIELDVFYAK